MAENAIVGILRVVLGLDSAQFETGAKRSVDAARVLERQLASAGRQMVNVGQAMSIGITAPLVAFGFAASRSAITFESSFAGIIKTVDDATDSTGKLSATGRQLQADMRELAKVIPVNVNELNQVGEAAGQLGIKTRNIAGFTEVMAKLGVTTNLAATEAATMLARFDNITTGGAQETFEQMGAAIVALGNNLATTEREILEMAMGLAASGKQIGLTQADILALGGALSSLGLEAERGGTAFSRVMIEMQNAVLDGGESLETFRKVAGEDFVQVFRVDAAQAINNFIGGLARMSEEGKNINPILDELGLGGIRVSDALRRTGNAVERLTNATEISRRGFAEMSALNEEARKRFETTESKLKLLGARIRDVGITIGNAMLPTINLMIAGFDKLIPVMEAVANGFNLLPRGIQAIAIGLLAFVAALGPAIFMAGQLAFAASSVAAAFTKKGLATRALTAIMPMLTRVTMAQAAADNAAAFAAGRSGVAMAAQAGIGRTLGMSMAVAGASAKGLISALASGIGTIARTAVSFFGLATPIGAVRAALIGLAFVVPQVRGMLGDLVSILGSMARILAQGVRSGFDMMTGAIKSFGSGLTDSIPFMSEVNGLLDRMARRASVTADAWKRFADAMSDARKQSIPSGAGVLSGHPTATDVSGVPAGANRAALLQGRIAGLPTNDPIGRQLAAMVGERDRVNAKAAADAIRTLSQRYDELQAAVSKLTPAQRAQIDAGNDLGLSTKDIAQELSKLGKEFTATEDVIRFYTRTSSEFTKETDRAAEAIADLSRELSGQADIDAAQQMLKALDALSKQGIDIGNLGIEEQQRINTMMLAAIQAYRRLSLQLPTEIKRAFDASARAIGTALNLTPLAGLEVGPSGVFQQPLSQRLQAERELATYLASTTTELDLSQVIWPDDASGRMRDASLAIADVMARLKADADAAAREFLPLGDAIEVVVFGIDQIADSSESAFGRSARSVADFIATLQLAARGIAQMDLGLDQIKAATTTGQKVSGYANLAAGGAQVAGGFMAATASGSDAARIGKGALYGAQVGGQFGPFGALVGLGVGAIGGVIRSTQPSKEEKEARMAYAAWADEVVGHFLRVADAQLIVEAGGERWKQVNIAVRDAYIETGKTAAEAMQDLAILNRATHVSAEAVAEAQERINEALRQQEADFDRLTAAIERYGIAFEQAGQAFQDRTLHAQAKELIEDWRVLIDSGMSVAEVNAAMAPAINEFLNASIRTGTTIPTAIKPILDSLAAQGLLVSDTTGAPITNTDVNQLPFADIFTHGLDEAALALDRFIERLNAANNGPLDVSRLSPSTIAGAQQSIGQQPRNLGERLLAQELAAMEGWARNFFEAQFAKNPAARQAFIDSLLHRYGAEPETKHTGGVIAGAGEVPIKALGGEGVVNHLGMQSLGSQGLAAINAGRLQPTMMDGMGAAMQAINAPAFSSCSVRALSTAAPQSASASAREGDIAVYVQNVNVKSDKPEQSADAFVRELPRALRQNGHLRHVLRTQLR